MIHSIQCVHCQAVLKVPTAIPSGKKVKCPKCQQTFIYEDPGSSVESSAPEAPTSPVNESSPPADELPSSTAQTANVEEQSRRPLAIPNMDLDADAPQTSHAEEQSDAGTEQDEDEVPEAEETAPAKKKRRDDEEDEDEDERPRSRKKRRDEDDEDDEDRRPKNKKSRNDDEDDDDNRTAKKKKKKANNTKTTLMVLGGLGCGFLALIACLGCGVGGYFFIVLSAPDITGTWESTNQFGQINTYEFRKDNTVTITTRNQNFGNNLISTRNLPYRVERGNPPVLVFTEFILERRADMDLKGNELTLNHGFGSLERLRKK